MDASVTPLRPRRRELLSGRARATAALMGVIDSIEAHDPATVGHSRRVAALCDAIARKTGELTAEERTALVEAALLHDVGKIVVPGAILGKPGRLTAQEFARVREHSEVGSLIVRSVLTHDQARWVRHHHERWDGRGYPDGIPLGSLHPAVGILGLADAYDAMTSRGYSGRMSFDDALTECLLGTGTQFAPSAVSALMRIADAGSLQNVLGTAEYLEASVS